MSYLIRTDDYYISLINVYIKHFYFLFFWPLVIVPCRSTVFSRLFFFLIKYDLFTKLVNILLSVDWSPNYSHKFLIIWEIWSFRIRTGTIWCTYKTSKRSSSNLTSQTTFLTIKMCATKEIEKKNGNECYFSLLRGLIDCY